MIAHRFRLAIFLIAICAHPIWATAQNSPQNTLQGKPRPPQKQQARCLPAQEMKADQLHGQWAVRFVSPPAGLPARATMRLQRHAEFSESLAGSVSRDFGAAAGSPAAARPDGHAAQAQLAGDLDEGLLLLDESSDGVSITGTWNGEMVAGSCGKAYQGVWKDTSRSAPPDAPDVPFTLTRLP